MKENDNYIEKGHVTTSSIHKRDFAKAVVINKFTQQDIKDMISTLDINNKPSISNDKVKRLNDTGYKAEFDLDYTFPTESSATLFKVINQELENGGKTHNYLELNQNGKDVKIKLSSNDDKDYVSGLQNSSLKLTKANVLNKERRQLSSELFTSTVSQLLSSDLYNFFQENKKHEQASKKINDVESFKKFESNVSGSNFNKFLKVCIAGQMIEHNQDLNVEIINTIRSVEHTLLQEKKEHINADITLAGKNFELGHLIDNLQSLQIDLGKKCDPSQKVDRMLMKDIRNLIKSHGVEEEPEILDPQAYEKESNTFFSNFMQSMKDGITQAVDIALNNDGKLINKKDADFAFLDPTRHSQQNKYV